MRSALTPLPIYKGVFDHMGCASYQSVAENLIKGSVHEHDFFIVHDAPVLMTAKETIELMK